MTQTQNHRPQKMALIVAKRIVDDIRRGNNAPGDKLPAEPSMIQTYQVGRGTLRESLRFLELQGVISLKPGPGGGPIVEKPDASNLATTLLLMLQFENARFGSVVEARQGIEPLLARLAAQHITTSMQTELEATVSDMRDGLNDTDMFLHANRRFHLVLARASENPVYSSFLEALIGIVDGTQFGVSYPPHRRSAILRAHTKIYEAVAEHDGDSSATAMQAHMQEYANYIARKFPDALLDPVTWSRSVTP